MKLKPYSTEFFIAILNKTLYPAENFPSQTVLHYDGKTKNKISHFLEKNVKSNKHFHHKSNLNCSSAFSKHI